MVTVENVRTGMAAYADREILNKLPVGTVKRVIIGSAIAMALQNSIEPFLSGEVATTLGITKDGMVDVDMLKNVIMAQIPEDGVKVDIPFFDIKMTFRREDINAVCNDINGVAV